MTEIIGLNEITVVEEADFTTVIDVNSDTTVIEVAPETEVILVHEGPAGKQGVDGYGVELEWSRVTEKPTTFPPSPHNHETSDIINLVSTLNSIEGNINSTELMPDLAVLFENAIA